MYKRKHAAKILGKPFKTLSIEWIGVRCVLLILLSSISNIAAWTTIECNVYLIASLGDKLKLNTSTNEYLKRFLLLLLPFHQCVYIAREVVHLVQLYNITSMKFVAV